MTSQHCLTLYHVPIFRSSRSLWIYYELEQLYKTREDFPKLELICMDGESFRKDKPKQLLEINENGKVPAFKDSKTGAKMFEGCAIMYYLLEQYDFDGKLSLPNDPEFRAALHTLTFYTVSTVDNLSAMSSPIQRVITDLKPGQNEELIALNKKAFQTVVGPILSKQLAGRDFMYGDKFTALDCVLGYALGAINRKRQSFLDGFDSLKNYAIRMRQREAFAKAVDGNIPKGLCQGGDIIFQ